MDLRCMRGQFRPVAMGTAQVPEAAFGDFRGERSLARRWKKQGRRLSKGRPMSLHSRIAQSEPVWPGGKALGW